MVQTMQKILRTKWLALILPVVVVTGISLFSLLDAFVVAAASSQPGGWLYGLQQPALELQQRFSVGRADEALAAALPATGAGSSRVELDLGVSTATKMPPATPTSQPTATPTANPTSTATPTAEPTSTATPTQEPAPTVTPNPQATATPETAPTPTVTPSFDDDSHGNRGKGGDDDGSGTGDDDDGDKGDDHGGDDDHDDDNGEDD